MRHVLRADEREVERARDRRGRKREHIHQLEQLLEFLLVQTPKRCSSSITTRPRSLNTTSLEMSRCVPMTISTPPSRRSFNTLRCSRVRAEAAEHFDPHRIIEHALAESFEMLLREHGRRREHRDLFAFHHGLERRADRDLRFAETDIAADQPIHRARLFHVRASSRRSP